MAPFRRRSLLLALVLGLGAAPAWGQAFGPLADHLKCYKVKDPLKLKGVVDLDSPQLGLEEGCKIGKAKLFCVPVRKKVVQVTPATPMAILGDQQVDDRLCYKIKCPVTVIPDKDVVDQFGMRVITKFKAQLLCTPARKKEIEIDFFPTTQASVAIAPGSLLCGGGETVQLSGPTEVHVVLGALADTDGNGREQVPIELVAMSLTGNSSCYGPVTVTLRAPAKHPHRRSTGEIEETTDTQAGRLDLPPFAPSGTASSFFDVYFEVTAMGLTLHNHTPKHMESVITHKPPDPGDTYQNLDIIQLYDDDENPFPIRVGSAHHTPNPTTTTTTLPPPGCGLQSSPEGPTCGGACPPGLVCLWDRPNANCECVPPGADCSQQPAPFACPNGFCPRPDQSCQPVTTNCGCVP